MNCRVELAQTESYLCATRSQPACSNSVKAFIWNHPSRRNSWCETRPLGLRHVVNFHQSDACNVAAAANDRGVSARGDGLDQGGFAVVGRLQPERDELVLLAAKFPIVIRAQDD